MALPDHPRHLHVLQQEPALLPSRQGLLHRFSSLVRLLSIPSTPPLITFLTLFLFLHRGLIGPERQFGRLALYHPALYALGIGAVLPIPVWLWARKRPQSWIRNINFIVLLNGPTSIPAATGVNYASFVLVGFIFRECISSLPPS